MSDFDRAFSHVVGDEGGYVNDPRDPGGETKFGISKRAYPHLDIANLTLEQAKAIYLPDYWLRARCDRLAWPLSLFVFDSAVNQGVGAAQAMLATAGGDPVKFLAKRALRYADNSNFDRFGEGWMRRLFRLAMA